MKNISFFHKKLKFLYLGTFEFPSMNNNALIQKYSKEEYPKLYVEVFDNYGNKLKNYIVNKGINIIEINQKEYDYISQKSEFDTNIMGSSRYPVIVIIFYTSEEDLDRGYYMEKHIAFEY